MVNQRTNVCHDSHTCSVTGPDANAIASRSAPVGHASVPGADFDVVNAVAHAYNADKHTLSFILNTNTSRSTTRSARDDPESTRAHHRSDSGDSQFSRLIRGAPSQRIVAPSAAQPATTSSCSTSGCERGDGSPSMAVSAMFDSMCMSSPSTYSLASSRYHSCPSPPGATLSPPAISCVARERRKSSSNATGRALTASRWASQAGQLSKLEKKRGRMCKMDGCENYIVHKGLCCRHGGGKKCTIAGCNTSAKHLGLCWKHGGSIECDVDGCTKRAKARRLCWAHGGGTKCTSPECEKVAVSRGFCWAHGGGKRCNFDECNKPAYKRTQNFCAKHHAEMQHVNYFEV